MKKKSFQIFLALFTMTVLILSVKAFAFFGLFSDVSGENPSPISEPESENLPIPESTASIEALIFATLEADSLSPEALAPAPPPPPEEGSSYKGVPWCANFNTFKEIKVFGGGLAPYSAACVGSADDNDIAMLLGAPVSEKDSNGLQRVRFEYVPRKFASVYYEPDDLYYIFYDGKFALTFSKINSSNFDLYRDTFYKKYSKTGSFSAKFGLGKNKSYLLQAAIFEKGRTVAFLIKGQTMVDKKTFVSTKLVFADRDQLDNIRKEIEALIAADKLSGSEKKKQEFEKDLNKIE